MKKITYIINWALFFIIYIISYILFISSEDTEFVVHFFIILIFALYSILFLYSRHKAPNSFPKKIVVLNWIVSLILIYCTELTLSDPWGALIWYFSIFPLGIVIIITYVLLITLKEEIIT
ncbi:hypothetical protein HN832_03595 [archaeon]|jgi:hypothetical protein|nr:hypothetical protein [archaeon]MBT4373520.1 hypothetical protein [archaeon]MBT4531968.1 hypothetical protein [archaeon]MBT7001635.1 hypothetical protein [archaeon]MBT7282473.1 hypothetical protein [archaeon]